MSPRPEAGEALRLLIVDDEALARMRLKQLVEGLGEPSAIVVAEADSAAAAQVQLARLAQPGEGGVDALLLDIGLPGPSGLALAATLRAMPQPPAVVFVTAHAGHALQAFELQALDYLTKPVRKERLQQALARVAQWRRAGAASGAQPLAEVAALTPAPVLVLNERGRVLRLPHGEIVSLRAEHKAVVVRTAAKDYVVDESLNELEQRLGEGFLRVHRNALVARGAIRALELRPGLDDVGGAEGGEGWAVLVGNPGGGAGEWLSVSRRQVATVKGALAVEPPRGGAGT